MSNNGTGYVNHLRPHVSFVMPCYNEAEVIGYTIPQLVGCFEQAGVQIELIAVDNGSRDRTGEIIQELAASNPAVRYHRVERNRGYGNGILAGLPLCTAPWIGIIPADGQVDAEDVVRLYQAVAASSGWTLGKVRRRFRLDGLNRKVVSVGYNVLIQLFWPGVESLDINGNPKVLPREAVERMQLESRQWFLDPEIMIKSHFLGLRVLELNVFARMRGGGVSHVRKETCLEFLRNLLIYRFTPKLAAWRGELAKLPPHPAAAPARPVQEPALHA